MRYDRVIFCSRDCTYRAPVAAEILKRKLEITEEMKSIVIDARGRVVLFPEPVNGKAVAIGKSRGYSLDSYVAVGLKKEDLDIDTLVLVMTQMDKKKVYDTYDNAINVYTVKEFIGAEGDIEVPFGRGLASYGESFKQIENLVSLVADRLLQK